MTRPHASPRNQAREQRRWSLSRYLLAFGLVLLVPAFGLGTMAAWQSIQSYQREFESRLHDTARALALALDSELDAVRVAAMALATSPLLRLVGDVEMAGLAGWAAEYGAAVGATQVDVHAAAPDQHRLLTTAVTAGSAVASAESAAAVLREVVETSRPAVSDLLVAQPPGTHLIAVAAPVMRDGRVERIVVLHVAPDRFSKLLKAQVMTPGAGAALVDAERRIVARSRDATRFIGQPLPSWYTATSGRTEGILRGASIGGKPVVVGFRRLPQTPGWSVIVGEPSAVSHAMWREPFVLLACGALGAMLLGSLAAFWLARGILRPIEALRRQANDVAAGTRDALTGLGAGMPSRVAEFEDLRRSLHRAHEALQAGEARLRVAIDAARFSTWEFDASQGIGSRRGELTNTIPTVPESGFGLRDWLAHIHPGDRADVEQAMARTIDGSRETFAAEFRVRAPSGQWIWIASHGAVVEHDRRSGRVLRIAGVAQDITERRAAADRQALLTRELDHRAKNALAVVQAALRLTPKDDAEAYARAVEGRVMALARAHTLLAESRWLGADMRSLIEGELAPFLAPDVPAGSPEPRAVLDGPPITLPPAAAQPLSMALHELATNAMKYGALSAPHGRVSLSWRFDEAAGVLRLRWVEAGGPAVAGEPARRGFGSRVLQATICAQLAGTLCQAWNASGLACDIVFPLSRNAADRPGH